MKGRRGIKQLVPLWDGLVGLLLPPGGAGQNRSTPNFPLLSQINYMGLSCHWVWIRFIMDMLLLQIIFSMSEKNAQYFMTVIYFGHR